MITCVLTSSKEEKTVGYAIQALIDQPWEQEYEVLVVCPDESTADVVRTFTNLYPQVHLIKDAGEGKPAAINLALSQAQGDICVFTDGDVQVEPGAILPLLVPFTDEQCGAVTGRPISCNPRNTMLGYWSHLLTDAGAHSVRQRRANCGAYLDCSGYLYAVRCNLLSPLPKETLADDAYLSSLVWMQGKTIAYAPEAKVSVRYPTHYDDWRLQKIRSTAGAAKTIGKMTSQRKDGRSVTPMRSFFREAIEGVLPLMAYPRSWKEAYWTVLLVGARIHLWLTVWIELHFKRRNFHAIWQRVESTK